MKNTLVALLLVLCLSACGILAAAEDTLVAPTLETYENGYPILDYEGFYAYVTGKGAKVPVSYEESSAIAAQMITDGTEGEVQLDDVTIRCEIHAEEQLISVYFICTDRLYEGATEYLLFDAYAYDNDQLFTVYNISTEDEWHELVTQIAVPEVQLFWIDYQSITDSDILQLYPYPSWLPILHIAD